jgi:hypothetical protein
VRVLRRDAPLPADAAVDRQVAGHALHIDCARRDGGGRVTHVGGPAADGTRWMLEIAAVIDAVQNGAARYYVTRGSEQIGLQVQQGQLVTMTADGWSVDSLPACSG